MLKLTDRPWWKSSNVTKFDKIMPKLQNLRCLWQFLRAYLVFGKKIEPTFENVYSCWTNFHRCKWYNIEKII